MFCVTLDFAKPRGREILFKLIERRRLDGEFQGRDLRQAWHHRRETAGDQSWLVGESGDCITLKIGFRLLCFRSTAVQRSRASGRARAVGEGREESEVSERRLASTGGGEPVRDRIDIAEQAAIP
jgi:hypothetical protein